MRSAAASVFVGLFSMLAACASTHAQDWGDTALRTFAGLTEDQWTSVNRGELQVNTLDTPGKREVAVVGVARLRATTACFITTLQDIENFKKSPPVLRIRKFAIPMSPQDLEGFSLQNGDLAGLRDCRAGDCNTKLPARVLERLGYDTDWSRPDHAATAQSVLREEMQAYIERYFEQGNAALIEYRDKGKAVRLADEFRAVLDARHGLAEFVPEFHEYLARYPNSRSSNFSEFFYWSTETFGLKPVTSVTHVSVYAQPGRAVVASKQIYASHYFDASLGLTASLDDGGEASNPGMYLVYLNRSRIDLLGGFFGRLRRAFLGGRLRDGMRKNLAEAVRKLESSCATHPKATPNAQ